MLQPHSGRREPAEWADVPRPAPIRVTTEAEASVERLQLALDAGAIIGTWVWHVPDDRFIGDERFARSFSLDAVRCRDGLVLEEVAASIHPDDSERVGAAVADALARGGAYRCEYRVRQGDGDYRWVEANGRVELDDGGRPVRFPGVLLDIEHRRRAEDERDRANALLRTFIEAVPGVVFAKDRDGRLIVANRGVAELVGLPPEDFIGRTDLEILDDKQQAAEVMATDRRIMDTGVAEQIEEQVRLPDGTPAWWLSTKAPLRDDNGTVVGLIGSSIDITERKRQQERARFEAEMLDLLNRTGSALAGELDLQSLLQRVTDAATRLTGAQFGAFFYNGVDERGEAYMLYTLAGAPIEAFDRFGHPRPTPLFDITFRGGPPVRIDDVLEDPRYGQWGPHHGMPAGHLPVRSYLAVPVRSRAGDVLGGLFFGHAEAAMFSERSERLASGIAAQAAVAIDNARLYAEAQTAAEERKLLLESERAARTEAERASALKDEFLAALSHELRTPLNAIVGWLHVLRRTAGDQATLQRGLDVIHRSARAQTQLIEDLLDMSRITSGKLQLDREVLLLADVVEAGVDAVRPAAEAAGVALEVQVAAPATLVRGDARRLQQVAWNLLSNAVKFTPAGGRVNVDLAREGDRILLRVRDTGIGIPAHFLPHVFDRFRQADGSTTRRFGGLGLGLSIVRQLVDLHGGGIRVDSDGEGRGACFTVQLPAATPDLPATAPMVEPSMTEGGLRQQRVLVVDDDPVVLDLLVRLLSEAGAQVRVAEDAVAALRLIEAEAPALLISDIGMPGMDGFELIRRVRALSPAQGGCIPAIALTAFARHEDRTRALASGFAAHLSKPVEPSQLLALASQLVGECSGERADPRSRLPAAPA